MILPTAYFPSIFQWAKMTELGDFFIETKEHFVKQSYRNRCEIYGANGKLNLIVPLSKWKNHSTVDEVKVSYDENWQALHWKSIESAYRNSPYFEFYEEELSIFFNTKQHDYLIDINQLTIDIIKQLLNTGFSVKKTVTYEVVEKGNDWRKTIHPKNKKLIQWVKFPEYIQVFEDKKGFIPNLSILDLLFNLGPDSNTYINRLIHLTNKNLKH